ncbi:glycosyl hydrolase family 95 catalytic domain-containing protein [Sunxiuqinia rutila]|uniref:glycosyl hydrolase family 95 catalytic domain-containing protein n=1 Tax=Sunxiuqinia rutila TaxID=1397841 RepID=UPI003D36511D
MQLKSLVIIVLVSILFLCGKQIQKPLPKNAGNNLVFYDLADVWDEAMPLGNAMVGSLIWQKEGKLRFSLDRADLWDLRPMENIDFDKWKFQNVYKHWKSGEYKKVQEVFDVPYDKLPAPSKIPAGALEFDIAKLGKVKLVSLDVETATCVIDWENGAKLTTFVHAEKPLGWYKFENLPENISIELVSPAYNRENTEGYTSQAKTDLKQLGYEQGGIVKNENSITYNQKGWGDFSYQIYTSWEEKENELCGCWSVSSANKGWEPAPLASEVVRADVEIGYKSALKTHLNWWKNYWNTSSISVPDSLLQRQYMLEMYKFGSAARGDAAPIALQSVWTADHGKLPPWKGDFHHDLNTQLSYWPAYAGNYLNLEEGFLNWLWKYRPAFKKYTKDYFGVEGMNVPGVTTLEGEPMGGWIQYSMGQSVASWLGHHFYMHWKFSMDRDFLENRAYPWLKDVAIFLDEVSVKGENDKRKLIMSSSPEIYNNSGDAWFAETTNFDLALIRWTYEKAAELATELGLKEEAEKWSQILAEWTELSIDPETGLMFAPGFPYDESHRHFSHLLAYHPLGLLDVSKGEADKSVIDNTLRNLEKQGSGGWTGYSFSWQGNLYARAFDGENAARVLRIFAECFCLKNSFHVNGDQCKAGHSNMTYRPFTLEGNFAFASGIQEMLIQSHTGVVKLFPAIPEDWNDVSFEQLRTYGAFVISANKANGLVQDVKIVSEKGGLLRMQNPFAGKFEMNKNYQFEGDNIVIEMQEGEVINLKSINL